MCLPVPPGHVPVLVKLYTKVQPSFPAWAINTPDFKCKDIGMECGFEASAWTEGGLMKKISVHAAEVHNIKEISPDLMDKIKKAIK